MQIAKFILVPVLLLSMGSSLQGQTDFYVSPSGDNSQSGTSLLAAWETIQYAMDHATPNSVVHILAGTYNEKVEVNVSGTTGNPIVFQNYNSEMVTISGTGISTPDAIIGIFDQSYITIKGLIIANNEQLDAQGIIIEGNCSNIKLLENEVRNINFSSDPNATANSGANSQPIIVYGSDDNNAISNLIIDGNMVHDSRTGYSEGLAVNGNVDGFEVTNNTVHDISNIGIDLIGHEGTASANDQARNGLVRGNLVYNCKSPYATAAGIYVDGARDIVIENNIVHDNQWGIEIGCENLGKTTSGIMVRNNLIYDNDDAAIAMGGFDFPSGSGKVIDCSFINNSCYNNDLAENGVGGVTGEVSISYTENCRLENNIFYAGNSADLVLYVEDVNSINLVLDYNLYYILGSSEFEFDGVSYATLANYQLGTSQDLHSIFGDPEFENILTSDFHLSASSPAIDKGNPNFVAAVGETDLDGDNRVQDQRVDMGSDEYGMTVGAHIQTDQDCILIYPNPFSDKVVIDGDFNNYEIKVFNSVGTLLADYSGAASPLSIDLDALGEGVYFISVQHSSQTLGIYKMIKQSQE